MEDKKMDVFTEVSLTDEELAEIQAKEEAKKKEEEQIEELINSGYPLKLKINRLKKPLVDKITTPLYKLENMFISEQEGRGNAEATIKYYKLVFRKLYAFAAYNASADAEEYKKGIERYGEETMGKIIPIVFLESDDLQNEFRWYLINICNNNEQTIQNNMRGLRAIVKYAMGNDWINPVKIKVKDVEPPIRNVFTDKEIEILSQKPNPEKFIRYRNWVIVRYMMATGNRCKSVAGLLVGDIDFTEGMVNVNIQKNRLPVRLYLVKQIQRELREYIAYYRTDDDGNELVDEPLFITAYGEAMTPTGVSGAVRDYCQWRGLSKTSAHLLRHTFAKNHMTGGGDVLSLKIMLGHQSLKMVNRYANLYGADIKDMVEEHALINKAPNRTNRKKVKMRK